MLYYSKVVTEIYCVLTACQISCCSIFLFLLFSSSAPCTPPERIAQLAFPSTLLLERRELRIREKVKLYKSSKASNICGQEGLHTYSRESSKYTHKAGSRHWPLADACWTLLVSLHPMEWPCIDWTYIYITYCSLVSSVAYYLFAS